MDIIFLPLLSPDATLLDADFAMNKHLRAAVVRGDQQTYSLIRAVDVYAGLAQNLPTLGALPERFPMHTVSALDIQMHHLDMIDPSNTWHEFEQLLDSVKKKYGVLGSLPGIVRVVTRHEGLADQFSSAPTACYCDNEDYMHPYPPPNVSAGDLCYCGFKISCR